MSVLSAPLTDPIQKIIQDLIDWGFANNKDDVTRKALERMHEAEAMRVVFESEEAVKSGKILAGDLSTFL
jgi:Arc/MetJ-type ribon-helix-helix transcriptional regulator